MGKKSAKPAAIMRTAPVFEQELARTERARHAVIPVLRHMLANEGPSLVNEAVVARVRGMLGHLAQQAYAGGSRAIAPDSAATAAVDAIAARLADQAALLAHVHALALESQLAEKFGQRLSLDPVLSPLLQELIASDDRGVAELAMGLLAAQARFMQSQRRMELPLAELPADLLNTAIRCSEGAAHPASAAGFVALRDSYDEAATRLGLLERLIRAMRGAVVASLSFDRAGLALFASGVASAANVPRAEAVISCSDQQGMKLALLLRAAGLDLPAIERQMLMIGMAAPAPCGIADISTGAARQYLAEQIVPHRGEV